MASSLNHFCSLCQSYDALTWCTNCDTFLCYKCEKYHSKSKSSLWHTTISIEDYENLPKFILETSNRCENHDKGYELYCSLHGCACCVDCLKDKHIECKNFSPLSDMLVNIKSSAAVSHLENNLQEIQHNFNEIARYLSDRKATLERQKTVGIEEIKSMRGLINDHLDRIEKQLLDDLSIRHAKLTFVTEELMNEINNRKEQIGQMQEDITKIIQFATDLQTYVGLRKMEKITTEEMTYIDDLQMGANLNKVELGVSISSNLKSFVSNAHSFGDVSVESVPCNLNLQTGKGSQVQVVMPMAVSEIKPILKKNCNCPAWSGNGIYLVVKYYPMEDYYFLTKKTNA